MARGAMRNVAPIVPRRVTKPTERVLLVKQATKGCTVPSSPSPTVSLLRTSVEKYKT